MAWPFKPFIQNEKDKAVKQVVDVQLQPGEKTTCRYMFRAPLQKDQKQVHMLLQLVEPKDYDKFCNDTIVVVVNVQSSHQDADSVIGLGISMIDADDDYMSFSAKEKEEEEEEEEAPNK